MEKEHGYIAIRMLWLDYQDPKLWMMADDRMLQQEE
jgi:hypothetical protein